MKPLVIAFLMSVSTASSLWAQANIAFGNSSAFPLRVSNFIITQTVGTASTMLGPASVRITLLVGANGAPLSTMVPVTASTGYQVVTNTASTLGAAQGSFAGGNPAKLPTSAGVFDGTAAIQFMYVAWSINSGYTSFNEVYDINTGLIIGTAGFITASPLITGYTPATGATTPTATFGSNPTTQLRELIFLVPEPGTVVLTGLGIGSLMLFRRRKQPASSK